jgi:hypothetical protein
MFKTKDGETRRGKDREIKLSPLRPVSVSPCRPFPQARRPALARAFASLMVVLLTTGYVILAQSKRPKQSDSKSSHSVEALSPEAREMVGRAMAVVCIERKKDPKGSNPIDDMQGRPSLPVQSEEAIEGAQRAQRLLPIAKNLVVDSLRRLAAEYTPTPASSSGQKIQRAIARVQMVKRVKPDMDSRDNASVLLGTPFTITFGTIFLVGLPSDEAMISVLSHELMHIADGDQDTLRPLFRAIGNRAAALTGLRIQEQRAEELVCDLVGAMAARAFVTDSPSYEPLPRRIARAFEHNCVDEDEGDEDHLSPRNTMRALLTLNPALTRELIYGQDESRPARTPRGN